MTHLYRNCSIGFEREDKGKDWSHSLEDSICTCLFHGDTKGEIGFLFE